MNVLPLSPTEVSAIASAKTAVTNAKIGLDKANSDYLAVFNSLLTARNLTTGPSAPILSSDGLYLLVADPASSS